MSTKFQFKIVKSTKISILWATKIGLLLDIWHTS